MGEGALTLRRQYRANVLGQQCDQGKLHKGRCSLSSDHAKRHGGPTLPVDL